ncbi:MAG TPA: glycosyl hydrolase [Armatimonadota bacterium]|nr:glycosyl hydrolase [Armatimonadota bacterium]
MIKRNAFMLRLLALLALMVSFAGAAQAANGTLASKFQNPPDSARPQVWWHWLAGNVSKAGITADLEAWKQEGIGGGTIGNISFQKEGPAPFNSPAWWGMVKHAVSEAHRLGLQLGFFNCEGWSSSGGPWITPDIAMQMAVWSEERAVGGTSSITMPQPYTRLGYYRDAAVVAFPTPASETQPDLRDLKPAVTDANGADVDGAALYDGAAATSVGVPAGAGGKVFLQFAFDQPFTAAALRMLPGPEWNRSDVELQVSDDGTTFRSVRRFSMPGSLLDSGTEWLTSGNFPPVTGRYFRLVFQDGSKVSVAEFNLMGPAAATPTPIPAASIVDLTDRMDSAGRLNWKVPAGDWTIVRFGHTPIGVHNHPVTKYGDGLEVDKLSRAALKKHFTAFVDRVIDAAGPLAGKTLVYSLIDSYECGEQNWTAKMPADFQAHCGYDIRRWLPVLTGRIVDSPERTARFREDFQQTIAELWSNNYYGYFAHLLHQRGLKGEVEAYGDGGFDDLRSAGLNDMPMTEFWFGNTGYSGLAKEVSSAGHTYGRPIIGAESFTSGDQYNFDPWSMKIEGDGIFSEGVNRYYFHSYAQQMYTDGRKPGMVWGNGIHFTRNLTWWKPGRAWVRYVTRCQYMLQQGLFAADILSYQGEGVEHFDGDPRPMKNPPAGYDFDGLDTYLLMHALAVKNGRLTLPSGMQYRLLALPNQTVMSPAVLRRIQDLVRAGAVVFGPKPVRAFGLSGAPESDGEVQRLADELWGPIDGKTVTSHRFGAGTVYWTGSEDNLQPVLKALKIEPDFVYTAPDAQIRFLHRHVGAADVYFVCNQETNRVDATCLFRQTGRLPEFWNPETGAIRPAPVWRFTADGRTRIPFSFAPGQSLFVVFEKPAPRTNHLVGVSFTSSQAAAKPSHTLVITRAVYAANDGAGTALDVTAALAAAVKHGALRAHATNIFFGTDPAPLHVKHLQVEYVYDGKPGVVTVPENALLRIPADAVGNESPEYELSSPKPGVATLTPWSAGDYLLTWSSGKVVRRHAAAPAHITLAGPWTVRFDPRWGGPAKVIFDRLVDWTKRPEAGIKYYSGTATYQTQFQIPAGWTAGGKVVSLDLGQLKNLAGVRLNGHDLGVLWKPPFRTDVTGLIRPGANTVEVSVTNLWANRLIGDSGLPANQRVTWTTNNPYHPDSPLQESGLLGPVTLQAARLYH